MPVQKWPSHLVLVRHATSDRNEAKINPAAADFTCGVRDPEVPLSTNGEKMAEQVARELGLRYQFDQIICSPYVRCVKTAEAIAARQIPKPRISFDERLREIEFGLFDGLKNPELEARFPKEWQRRKQLGKYRYRPPSGESWLDVEARVHDFLGMLIREYAGRVVLVVTHSVVIRLFNKLLDGISEAELLDRDRDEDWEVHNASVTLYRYDPHLGSRGKMVLAEYGSVFYDEKFCLDELAQKKARQTVADEKRKEQVFGANRKIYGRERAKWLRAGFLKLDERPLSGERIDAAVSIVQDSLNMDGVDYRVVSATRQSYQFHAWAHELVRALDSVDETERKAARAMKFLSNAFSAGLQSADLVLCAGKKNV